MLHLKSQVEIDRIRASCRIAAEAMLRVAEELKPGVTTYHLDQIADQYIRSQNAVASALGYHGIPCERVVKAGDILAVDIAVKKDGYHGDMNVSMSADQISPQAQSLLDATRQSLEEGLATCEPDKRLGDIGHAIQSYVEQRGFSIVREYCGHGIGRNFHEDPQLLHYGIAGTGRRLQPGMVFTIEPMVNEGAPDTRVLDDNWTAVTVDGKLSAQYEHTVAVTRDGPDVLSRFDDLPY
jgi:methionyl aminopeptidase